MLIKTQLRLTALLPAVFVLLIGSGLWASWIKIDQARGDAEIAEKTLRVNFELNILTQEYLLYGGARVETQLRIRHQSMGELLAQLKYDDIEEQELIDALRHGHQELGSIYNLLLESKTAAREQLAGALLVTAQSIRAKTQQYADIQHRQVVEFQRRADTIIMATLIILAVCSIALLTLLTRRLIRGINELGAGMLQVEAGNLQDSIPISSANELGALAQAFNGMIRKLRDTYTSIDALNKEITERKRATDALALQARIANVFITAPDDEMFNEVLKVILDIMHSPFGVFGFIDEAGALVVPTMTRQIWDKCQVSGKTFIFPRATWGDSSWPRAIREKKANYSNVISTKTPEGHVAVQRHISLPIIFQGEVIGLFQVANKETDYTEADLHTLAAIAEQVSPLLSARLRRERAQESLRQLNAELEERVQRRTAELEAANKELAAFSYSVSHDLRAPLRSIAGFVELLKKHNYGAIDDKGRHYMEVISASTIQMGKLIDDILTFSRIGRVEMTPSRVNLAQILDEVRETLLPQSAGRKIEWKIGSLPEVDGERSMLSLVLLNLLSNALKFTQPRDVAKIEIGTVAGKAPSPQSSPASGRGGERENQLLTPEVICYVRDNGVGFDMQHVNKLFGLFQRLHVQEQFEGTGVGLANVQRIIERHGGRVWAEGKENEGATFYFALPKSGS